MSHRPPTLTKDHGSLIQALNTCFDVSPGRPPPQTLTGANSSLKVAQVLQCCKLKVHPAPGVELLLVVK